MRSTCVARSPSPSWNHVGPPSALERLHEGPCLVAPAPALDRVVDAAPACTAAYRDRARSTSPRCSKSSPVLATTVRRPGASTRLKPERQLGAADAAGERDDAAIRSCAVASCASAKQVLGLRRGSARAGRVRRRPAQAAHDDHRLPFVGLAHQQRGGRGDLVGKADRVTRRLRAVEVGTAALVDQARAGPAAPSATPTVPRRQARPKLSLMITPSRTPKRACRCAAQTPPRCVGILRQQQHALAAVVRSDVGLVDPGIGHDESQPMLDDEHVRPPRARLRRDCARMTSTRRGSLPTSRASSTARADGATVARSTIAVLGLRHDLLRHHDDVAVRRRQAASRIERAISSARSSPVRRREMPAARSARGLRVRTRSSVSSTEQRPQLRHHLFRIEPHETAPGRGPGRGTPGGVKPSST